MSAQKVRTLIATGDVIPARSVNFQTLQSGDWRWPFLKTKDELSKADISFINLETPLISNCPTTNEGMIFCGDSRHLQGLTWAGIDLANLANNHAGNWGQEGIDQTVDLLNQNHIAVTGISGPTYLKVRGQTWAFLGYNDIPEFAPGLSHVDQETIKREITSAKTRVDLVIAAFHWGVEYTSQPTSRQRELAHLAIDSGADLVIGNHPHWIQPLEIYQGGLITYAHGNFIFDQMWSEKTRQGVVSRYSFYNQQLIDVEFLPIRIDNFGQPYFLEGKAKQAILDVLRRESLQLLNL